MMRLLLFIFFVVLFLPINVSANLESYQSNFETAYSLRQLFDDETDVVKIRRSSDDAKQNFNATEITDGTLESWVGDGSNGYVDTWYDQTVPTSQDRMYFDGVDSEVEFSLANLDFTQNWEITLKGVVPIGSYSNQYYFSLFDTSSSELIGIRLDNNDRYKIASLGKTSGVSGVSATFDEETEIKLTWDGTKFDSFENGVFIYSTTPSDSGAFLSSINGLTIGANEGANFLPGSFYDVSIKINGVEEFSTEGYGNTDADWTDQIGSNDGTVNGDPARAKITDSGIVVANDAIQETTSNQGLLVDSGSLVTDKGRPAIDLDGASGFLLSPSVSLEGDFSFLILGADVGLTSSVVSVFGNGSAPVPRLRIFSNNNFELVDNDGGEINISTDRGYDGTAKLMSFFRNDSGDISLHHNTYLEDDSKNLSGDFTINRLLVRNINLNPYQSKVQEIIISDSDLTSYKNSIENDIYDYYSTVDGNIYVMVGQSNMAGRNAASSVVTSTDNDNSIYEYYINNTTRQTFADRYTSNVSNYGPNVGMGRYLADQGVENIYVVRYAIGGHSVVSFIPESERLLSDPTTLPLGDVDQSTTSVSFINDSLGYINNDYFTKTDNLTFVWYQGAEDAKQTSLQPELYQNYEAHLNSAIYHYRHNINGMSTSTKVAIIRSPDWNSNSEGSKPYQDYVRQDQLDFSDSDSNTIIIDSDVSEGITATWEDGSHIDVATQERLGLSLGKALLDTTGPSISNINTSVSTSTVTITWETDENATRLLNYGLDSGLGISTSNNKLPRDTNHSISLTNLIPCNEYNFAVESRDTNLNSVISPTDIFSTFCTGDSEVGGSTSETIIVSSGGSLNNDIFSLLIPVDVKTNESSLVFKINEFNNSNFASIAGTPLGKVRVVDRVFNLSAIVDATTTITSFDSPIEITMTYADSDVSSIDESSLAIYRYDEISWNKLSNCLVDVSANTVTCETSQFSDFALFGEEIVISETEDKERIIGGGIRFGCKDKDALNYDYFSSHDQRLCQYENDFLIIKNTTYNFTKDLGYGDIDKDVRDLQKLLNSIGYFVANTGVGSPNNETNYFGQLTRQALIKYQQENNITPAIGYFGPITRNLLNHGR